jgi:23S rRNA pseudouridine1911/1915/1917 synthase
MIVSTSRPGLVVHPGSGNWSGTLLNACCTTSRRWKSAACRYRASAGQGHQRPDGRRQDAGSADRSGAPVAGAYGQALLPGAGARRVERAARSMRRSVGIRRSGRRWRWSATGKPARTHYRVVERFVDCTLVECALETGRTHQIRVHMTSIGHPLVGDPVYGGGASRVPIGPEFRGRRCMRAGWVWCIRRPASRCSGNRTCRKTWPN